MMTPEFIDNVNKTLKSSLKEEIKAGSKISKAAACFSIYAYQELQNELKNIEELRFIFTSPAFITEKAKKEKREFYIPRLNRVSGDFIDFKHGQIKGLDDFELICFLVIKNEPTK